MTNNLRQKKWKEAEQELMRTGIRIQQLHEELKALTYSAMVECERFELEELPNRNENLVRLAVAKQAALELRLYRAQCAARDLEGKVVRFRCRHRALAPGSSLSRMVHWNDLLPTAGLRKQNKKMIADQQAHIQDLVKLNRIKAARWQAAWTWIIWVWYVLRRPVSAVNKSLQGKTGT